jgi:xylulokinase
MYLGLDLGTSAVKAMLIDGDQSVVGSASAPLEVARPHPGWSEQNPRDWIAGAERAIAALRATHARELAAVRGIGLSGQMHGATLLDESDEPLRPCLLWNDTRAHQEAAMLDSDPRFRSITGNIVFPGFTAPKVAWVEKHDPNLFERVRRVLLPKDYLRLWLTGEHIGELSDASGTSWLDTGARRWSQELLETTHLTERHMPTLVEGTAAGGTLRRALAARLGMKDGVAVAGGAGDNAAAACGLGVVAEGAAFVSLGTSGVLFAASRSYAPNAASAVHTFCHALPATWHQMGVILSATDSLTWLATLTGATAAELTASLGERLAPPGRVTFLPYLGGERTPHNDAAARGVFVGLGHESDRRALTQAVVEGVAFALCDSRDALRAAGTRIARLAAVGGGTRSRYWLEVLATALGVPVDVPAAGDFGAAFGAARLGLIAATRSDPLAVCTPPQVAETVEPNATHAAAFAAAGERYRALYPAIRDAERG